MSPTLKRRIALEHRDEPTHLFHYTAAGALQSILEKGVLWATSIHHLNDQQEVKQFLELLADELRIAARGPSDLDNDSRHILERQADRVLEAGGPGLGMYVASFSAEGNLLSQWTRYCPPAGGYSLGIPLAHLHRQINVARDRVAFGPCVYDEGEQRQIAREVINDEIRLEREWHEYGTEYRKVAPEGIPERRVPPVELPSRALMVAPFIKHSGFCEEKEWRLVIVEGLDRSPQPGRESVMPVKLRPGAGSIIPFVEIELFRGLDSRQDFADERALKVWVGPSANADASADAVRRLLEATGRQSYGHSVAVEKSRIPYRGK
ncbi:MAG: DUF2971 domain-containing protein [Burkholderiaceae bacterium]|nr:DUF2971 domain-containing protein [Rhodocyclaceae bacterium]MCO5106335.1 DUF2971 domain-containing protein [Burkholderiaceae bacterium]